MNDDDNDFPELTAPAQGDVGRLNEDVNFVAGLELHLSD